MAETSAIDAAGLRKHYWKVEALKGVDLHVQAGTVYGLLGPTAPARRRPSAS